MRISHKLGMQKARIGAWFLLIGHDELTIDPECDIQEVVVVDRETAVPMVRMGGLTPAWYPANEDDEVDGWLIADA